MKNKKSYWMKSKEGNVASVTFEGSRVEVGFKNKKKVEKSFVAHDYCPWCGKKYNS